MDFCKNGQKLIEESQHENILPYNVKKNLYKKKKKKKLLIEEISNEINSDINLILKISKDEEKNKEELAVQGKLKVLYTRAGKNKRCLLIYLYKIYI
jgi:hypothetical protein